MTRAKVAELLAQPTVHNASTAQLRAVMRLALVALDAEWQPIETAPEGVRVLIVTRGSEQRGGGRIWMAARMKDGRWWNDVFMLSPRQVRFWMPLPPLPP